MVLLLVLQALGCRSKAPSSKAALPLPPLPDSGILEGQFIQTDYGFGIKIPSKWKFIPVPQDQEMEMLAQFCDPSRTMTARVSTRLLSASQKFSEKYWGDVCEQDLKSRQFTVKSAEKAREWETSDSRTGLMIAYRLTDSDGEEWLDQAWGLPNGDLLVCVHGLIPTDEAASEAGKKILQSLGETLGGIRWYTPIGPRGVSLGRYELDKFTSGFCAALESLSPPVVNTYFDEMASGKGAWGRWYKGFITPKGKEPVEVKAELSGLVINGEGATATFTLLKKGPPGTRPEKVEKSFRLSKREGPWKIQYEVQRSRSH